MASEWIGDNGFGKKTPMSAMVIVFFLLVSEQGL